jgi:cellulose 1,4-beta-cellobiosidase
LAGSAPPAPTGLTATPSPGQVVLNWNAAPGASAFVVARSTTSGRAYTTIANPTITTYTDATVTNETTYYYVVFAVNTSGISVNSAQVSAKPLEPAPSTPTGLAVVAHSAQVTLSWTPVVNATSYHVKQSLISGSGYVTIFTPISTTYTVSNLNNGTTYYFVVSAVNGGGESFNSAEVNATPQIPAPKAPAGLSATAGNNQVALTWSASYSAASYNVMRSTTNGSGYSTVGNPTTTSLTDHTALNGTTYYYVVAAINAGGQSPNSSQVVATPMLPVPAMPSGLTAVGQAGQALLSWSKASGATAYHVKRSTTGGSGYLALNSPAGTTYTDTNVTAGATYYYVVSAVNAGGESPNSPPASAKPLPLAPSAPTGLKASVHSGQVALSWNTVSGATSYHVIRSFAGSAARSIIGSPSATPFTDTGVTHGKTYYYTVSAVNAGGESANSSQASASP